MLLIPKYHSKCLCVILWAPGGKVCPHTWIFYSLSWFLCGLRKNTVIMRLHDIGIMTHNPHIKFSWLPSLLFCDKIVPPYFLITSIYGHRIDCFRTKAIFHKTYRGKSSQNLDFKISYEVQNRARSEFLIINLGIFQVLNFV